MNWTQRLLFAAAIAAIFSSGFLTGRNSVPIPTAPEQRDAGTSRARTHAERLEYLDHSLNLSDEQKEQLMATFHKWEKDMRLLEIEDEKAKLSSLQNHIPDMRAIMDAKQQARFDTMMKDITRRKEEKIRRKSRHLKRSANS